MLGKAILRLFQKRDDLSSNIESSSHFFADKNLIDKINFKNVVKRVVSNDKRGLMLDPLQFKDIDWYIQNNEEEFKEFIYLYYTPSPKEVYNMPKGTFLYRPVAYLQPIDSVIYQALVDKIIRYKRNRFSKQVYSDIINDINLAAVFHNPVMHWLDMRDNIRNQYSNGHDYYFFADISGYFENIKILKLIKNLKFYIGRHDVGYLKYLENLLSLWQYADAQGLIQPHGASSILAKVYLSVVDSKLGYLGKNYNRYVDEFHILARSKSELLKITLQLNEGLRDLGLNLNVAKIKLLEGKDIPVELDKNKDFFEGIAYLKGVERNYVEAFDIVKKKVSDLEKNYGKNKEVDLKVLRYCLHASQQWKWPGMVGFCLKIIEQFPEQTIDIIRYLNIFINDGSQIKIVRYICGFLRDKNKNLYNWQQVWFLALLFEVNDKNKLNFDLIWDIVNDENQDALSKGISFLIISKHLEDHELLFLLEHYKKTNLITLKRVLLFCLSKLPNTLTQGLFSENSDDPIGLRILKKFLRNNLVDISTHKIIE